MSCCLVKTTGRTLVAQYYEVTYQEWVDDPPAILPPPTTPPIGTTTSSGTEFVPFVGTTLVPCTRNGKTGYKMAEIFPDGRLVYLGECMISEGLSP